MQINKYVLDWTSASASSLAAIRGLFRLVRSRRSSCRAAPPALRPRSSVYVTQTGRRVRPRHCVWSVCVLLVDAHCPLLAARTPVGHRRVLSASLCPVRGVVRNHSLPRSSSHGIVIATIIYQYRQQLESTHVCIWADRTPARTQRGLALIAATRT